MVFNSKGIGRRLGGAIGGALDAAVDQVGAAGQSLAEVFRLPGLFGHQGQHPASMPGSAAGVEHARDAGTPPQDGAVRFVVIDYGAEQEQRREFDLKALLADERPTWASIRWIQVEGIHPYVINQLCKKFQFSSLAGEDVLHAPQRPRTENYDDHIFVVTQLWSGSGSNPGFQQVSMFLLDNLVLTFQEAAATVWDPIEARLKKPGSRVRGADGSYLLYALLDTIVDHSFPLMERYAERLDDLEDRIMNGGSGELLHQLHGLKRELTVVRRMVWPTRELVAELRRTEQTLVGDDARAYLADVEDHCVQLTELSETLRDLASSLTDLYLSMSSHRTNEAMRVLTVIATIFIPITFLAGVYGMNFQYIPGLQWRHAYLAFWLACGATTLGMLWYFKRQGWFDGR